MASSSGTSCEVEKVLNFLKSRGVSQNVLYNFEYEKMDVSAVSFATNECLEELGLTAKGDLFALKAFCQRQATSSCNGSTSSASSSSSASTIDYEKRKRELLEQLQSGKQKKKVKRDDKSSFGTTSKTGSAGNLKTRKISLGWLHFSEMKKKYMPVRINNGGGTRRLDVASNANKQVLIDEAKSLFFPDGKSQLGDAVDMQFELGNFKGECIPETYHNRPFTIQSYIDTNKLTQCRLYLRSKALLLSDEDEDLHSDSEEEDDIQYIKSCSKKTEEKTEQKADSGDEDLMNSIYDDTCSTSTSLIGSSEERQKIRKEQDQLFHQSLATDQEKEKKKREVKAQKDKEEKRLQDLRSTRLSRLPPEPEQGTPQVKIAVNHITKGKVIRSFSLSETMVAVYDWIGSLDVLPEYFTLCYCHGNAIPPSDPVRSVENSTLYMEVSDTPMPVSCEDAEVTFKGFASTSTVSSNDDTIPGSLSSTIQGTSQDYASLLECAPWEEHDPFIQCELDEEDEGGDPTDSTSLQDDSIQRNVKDLLDELAAELTFTKLSTFNISRSYIWEGTKRALSRKKFSPKNKVDVKFTDDAGTSEGAVDQGGPMREFFTLAIQWIESNMFCGAEGNKFLSFQAKFLDEDDYYFAGMVIALSIVHGGPGPQFLATEMYDALLGKEGKVSVKHVHDMEIKSLLQNLLDSTSIEAAQKLLDNNTLSTLLELAGTYRHIKELSDVVKMVQSTVNWYVLHRPLPAIESFKKGLSTLGLMQAMQLNPDAFRSVFCITKDQEITAETIITLFTPNTSPLGSNKGMVESLVLARWNDYLQDIEDGEERGISLRDILFFTTGCKSIPPRNIHPSIEFLHGDETSRFPKANTCAAVLRLPVSHRNYDNFKEDMSFGILNGQGFGSA